MSENMTPERWRAEVKPCAPGWEPESFTVLGIDGNTGPAFGWVKGSFGVYEGHVETHAGRLYLSSLTHLKSGLRVALFNMPETAALAGDLAERVGDWSEINGSVPKSWKKKSRYMFALWEAAGMVGHLLATATGSPVWAIPESAEKPTLNA